MLTLIQGGFFAGGHDMIKAQISSLTANGKRSILIVPEQQTVSAERELTDALPPSAPLFFEVTNFTRFANTVFRTLGGLTGESADTAKRSLIMWRAMTELAPVLEYGSKNGSVSSGSVTKMLGTVKQLQSFAITPKDLADVADELEGNAPGDADGRLISKLRDASKIMLLYKKLLSEHFSDTDDALLLTAEKLSANKSFLSDTVIFIDGFTSFTEPQYKVLGELLLHTEVTVSLTLPKSSPDAYEFAEIKAARERLIRLASEAGCNVAQKKIDGRSGASLMISELSSLCPDYANLLSDGEEKTVVTLHGDGRLVLDRGASSKYPTHHSILERRISMQGGKAHIDNTLCVGCGVCNQLCAFDAIG